MIKKIILCSLLFSNVDSISYAGNIENSVLKIFSFTQSPDYDAPWNKRPVKTNKFLGTLINHRQVLVTANATSHATRIEFQRFGSPRNWKAKIVYRDFNVNLAILEPEDPAALAGMKPLRLNRNIKAGRIVEVIKGKGSSNPSSIRSQVREISISNSGTANYGIALYQLEVNQDSGLGWSEPIISDNLLTGLTIGQQKNIIFAIPSSTIEKFLNHSKTPKDSGFIKLSIKISPLKSPYHRKWLKAENFKNGVLVTQVAEYSSLKGLVQPSDILFQVGQHRIDSRGYFQHKLWGRTHFIHLISRYNAGDLVKIKLLRNGKKLEIEQKVKRYEPNQELIPNRPYGQEPWLVAGGLVFQELSLGYLKSWGNNWMQRAPEHLIYLWQNHNQIKNRRRIIIISQVLADESNQGYQKLRDVIVTSINNQPINDLSEVKSSLLENKTGKKVNTIDLDLGKGQIILSLDGIEKIHKRIRENYSITNTIGFL